MPEARQPVRTQALMFTVWGGYIYLREIKAPVWIGSLIELLGNWDIRSRRSGWHCPGCVVMAG